MPELRNMPLIESFAMALETMAFASVEPAEDPVAPPSEPVLLRIDYRGALKGYIELVTSLELGRTLLTNILSCDPSDTLVMPNPRDPLVELINITCGVLLKRMGMGSKVEMSVPRVLPFDVDGQWRQFLDSSQCDVVTVEQTIVAMRIVEE